jgi:hypothetical protein
LQVVYYNGNTFYIDSSCVVLPLSDKFSKCRSLQALQVIKILAKHDTLLCNIKNMNKILADTFLMAMIDR